MFMAGSLHGSEQAVRHPARKSEMSGRCNICHLPVVQLSLKSFIGRGNNMRRSKHEEKFVKRVSNEGESKCGASLKMPHQQKHSAPVAMRLDIAVQQPPG